MAVLTSTSGNDATFNRGKIVNDYGTTDNNGNLKQQTVYVPNNDQNATPTSWYQQFGYDSLNRLTQVHEYTGNTQLDWQQAYSYDRWGNRLINNNSSATWGDGINNVAATIDTTNNRMLAVNDPNHNYIDYDAAGNQTKDDLTSNGTRTYDAENRMITATDSSNHTSTYSYDGDGRRVKRNISGTETWQVYGLGGELIAEYAQNGSASTPQKEYGYRNGQLLITVDAVSGSGGSGAPQNVVWTNAVGVSVSGNSLTKTASQAWGNGGASSTQSIASGDGYMEFTAAENNTHRICGLSNGDSNQDWTDIDFGIYVRMDGYASIVESGTYHSEIAVTYAAGDHFRVSVEGGVVKYNKNGTVFYTSTVAPTYPLLVDTSLYTYGSTISNVVISSAGGGGGGSQNVAWTSAVGVSASVIT